jgi:hypothetical protein
MFPTAVPLLNDINDSIWKAESACYPSSSYEDAPPRGHLGSWLVSKESLPLTLILGLMGFGILGATISSLVRRSIGVAKATSDGAYVTDIVGDVSRGLSAAMLVFLAAYGGLAVFGAADAQPNAYVLLFVCLAGAAFSDEVWKWTQKKLSGWLADRGGGGQPKPHPGTPAASGGGTATTALHTGAKRSELSPA